MQDEAISYDYLLSHIYFIHAYTHFVLFISILICMRIFFLVSLLTRVSTYKSNVGLVAEHQGKTPNFVGRASLFVLIW